MDAADVFPWLVWPEVIAKQAILSLVFAGGIFFAFRGAFRVKHQPEKSEKYTFAGYSNSELFRLSDRMQSALVHENRNWTAIKPKRVRTIAAGLDIIESMRREK